LGGQDSFRNAIIPDKGTTRERKLWGIYERCISIDLGCFRSRCLFPMLRNADSAKENEDPYPGRMSLIKHFDHRVAFVETFLLALFLHRTHVTKGLMRS